MKETIEILAQRIGFDLAGLVTQQFKEKYDAKLYATNEGCGEVFKRYVSRYFKEIPIPTNIIQGPVFDEEYEVHKWRW